MIRKIICLALALGILLSASLAEGNYLTVRPIETDAPDENDETGGEWLHVLLLGMDNRDSDAYSRSDCMVMLSLNGKTRDVRLTSFLRDTWVAIPGKGANKLNAACVYGGPKLTMKTINDTFGTNLESYAAVNLSCMAEIIDIMDGIDLEVTEEERSALNKGLFELSEKSGMEPLKEAGKVHLNGNQAVAYARIRHIDTDYRRAERQRTVLITLAKKLKNASSIQLAALMAALIGYVQTDLTPEEIMTLASVGLKTDLDTVKTLQIPYEGTFKSGTFDGVWCIQPDLKKNRKILKKFLK